jgi:SAM-dependent methyltransferase
MQNRFTLSEQALEYMPILERTNKIETWFNSDEEFNRLYPVEMQLLAHKHWTPLNIAKKAANFLAAEPHKKILDIGSGVGKFCLSAAYYKPNSFYYGVEQRENLIAFSEAAKNSLEIVNVSFIYGNFTQLNLSKFDHFYFYNSFYENLIDTAKIDDSIAYSGELYNYYNGYLFKQLEQLPRGTRLATFHGLLGNEIPTCFHIVGSEMDNLLQYWVKV